VESASCIGYRVQLVQCNMQRVIMCHVAPVHNVHNVFMSCGDGASACVVCMLYRVRIVRGRAGPSLAVAGPRNKMKMIIYCYCRERRDAIARSGEYEYMFVAISAVMYICAYAMQARRENG
jgi:hypothetical protein